MQQETTITEKELTFTPIELARQALELFEKIKTTDSGKVYVQRIRGFTTIVIEMLEKERTQEAISWLDACLNDIEKIVVLPSSNVIMHSAVHLLAKAKSTLTGIESCDLYDKENFHGIYSFVPKEDRGLYQKFVVTRTDCKDRPGERHHNCQYFVLDLDHDPDAHAALLAYAASCRITKPALSDALKKAARQMEKKGLVNVSPKVEEIRDMIRNGDHRKPIFIPQGTIIEFPTREELDAQQLKTAIELDNPEDKSDREYFNIWTCPVKAVADDTEKPKTNPDIGRGLTKPISWHELLGFESEAPMAKNQDDVGHHPV